MFYSLKSRLITVFILLFVLSFGAMSVVLFNESRSIIRSYIESSALEKMEEYGAYVDMVQMQIYDLASLVFNSETTKGWDRAVSDPDLPAGEKMLSHIKLSSFLTQATNSYTSVSRVTIYRENGLWISGDNQVITDPSFLDKQWYKDFKTLGKHWMSSHKDPVEERYNNSHSVISMLMPIGTFEPTHARTVMKVNVSSDYFLQPLNRIHLGQSGTIYLLDQEGEPLLSQSEYDLRAGRMPAVEQIRGDWRKQGVIYLENERGMTDIVVFKKLQRTNWMLVGFVSEEDLYSELFQLRRSIVAFASLLLVLSVLLAIWLSHSISKPLSRLVSAMRQVQRGDFSQAEMRLPPRSSLRNEVAFVTDTFRNMVRQLRQHIKNEFELKLLRQQAEYKALLMQINPHFLFNTLELMSSLAMQKRTDDTVKVIESLGKMMRFSLKMSDDLVPLEEELKYVKDYMSILQVRFGDRLHISLRQEGKLEHVTIIKFILQPLIENAVKYSFLHQAEACVDISVRRMEGRIHLRIADNGPGIAEDIRRQLLERSSSARMDDILTSRSRQIGLSNVMARCRLYYGDLFEIQIKASECGGTMIKLILPAQEEREHVQSIDRG
ncbi:sensor histidine kinase [Paenibacillus alkaliterrae]|uniref:sensor histidine kinase n=1 Tax=Paenibacillus alkaliterrae TaxID=320909 RepID=UPI001F3133F6|nr:sensor histidine kinase [Paenibacillus alkaliterrae]MCF2939136.1 sensor histidine kinase [Paenibacillus alkaliterrae]